MTNAERIIQVSKDNQLTHVGSCLTALPIIEEIYAIKKPDEKFILSSGHAHLAHAIVMAEQTGKDPMEYMKAGIHCDKDNGCDVSTGSLGCGMVISAGIAISNRDKSCYTIISDGECGEGSVWEALRFKADMKLDNWKVYVNCNGFSGYGLVNIDELEERLKIFCPDINIRRTQIDKDILNKYPQLNGLAAHYMKI